MKYERINLFGKKESRGTFDDFYSNKYKSLEDAYLANDYVECDFVKDKNEILYIEARNVKNPDVKEYYRLNYQHCPAGIDMLDDQLGAEMASKLL